MRINKVIENTFNNLNLKRIRLKSDPNNNIVPYEGYVLEECDDGTMQIYAIGAENPYMQITPDMIDVQQSLSPLDKIKLIIAGCVDKGVACQIKDLNNLSDIEATLLSSGCTMEDMYNIFKKYFLTNE
jgi:hypothetical protein